MTATAAALSIVSLQAHLDTVVRFLQPHLAFVNCHMVGYLTENLWQTHLPAAIRAEVRSGEDVTAAVQLFWDYHRDPQRFEKGAGRMPPEAQRFSSFVGFLRETRAHRLEHLRPTNGESVVVLGIAELGAELGRRGYAAIAADLRSSVADQTLQIKDFMSEKKNHEVEIAAQLVSALCGGAGTSQADPAPDALSVIDAGDGKGYLSSRLALAHRLRVLGIDANVGNTQGAEKRSAQLERAWSGLTKRAEDIRAGITPPRKGRRKPSQTAPSNNDPTEPDSSSAPIATNYQRSTHFITPATDFQQLFAHHFPDPGQPAPDAFCLSGLHTCGNLASSCLRIFETNTAIRALCNVGCCYHMLDELTDSQDVDVAAANIGFPMSDYLARREYALGRNARMLASQSLDRTVHARELPGQSLFYRALLEVLILERRKEGGANLRVGRVKGVEQMPFAEYVQRCAKRVQIAGLPEAGALNQLLVDRELPRRLMELFYLVRMTFAPVLETIVLLDRVLYLRERGVEAAFLVQLFDPVVSPRNVAVVALRR